VDNVFFPLSDKEAKEQGLSGRFSFNEKAEFPKRLRELRLKNRETLEVASKAIGITRSTLGLYEKGENVPDVKTLVRIARHYRASTNYLLGEDERPTYTTDYICRQTGLSEIAITKLLRMKQNSTVQGGFPEVMKLLALDTLLWDPNIDKFLILLYNYLFAEFSNISFEVDGKKIDYDPYSLKLVSKSEPPNSRHKGIILSDISEIIKAANLEMLKNALSFLHIQVQSHKDSLLADVKEQIPFEVELTTLMDKSIWKQ